MPRYSFVLPGYLFVIPRYPFLIPRYLLVIPRYLLVIPSLSLSVSRSLSLTASLPSPRLPLFPTVFPVARHAAPGALTPTFGALAAAPLFVVHRLAGHPSTWRRWRAIQRWCRPFFKAEQMSGRPTR